MTLESQPLRGSTFHVYLPLPNLAGQLMLTPSAAAQPVLLLLSSHEQPPVAITELSRRRKLTICRLQIQDDLDAVLRETQPTAIAWDLTRANPGDWGVIERLRSHPQLCHLPFIIYGQEVSESSDLASGMTTVLLKPVTGTTLIETLRVLRPTETPGSILIVDDDPEARAWYARLIAETLPGFAICTAETGAVALRLMAQETPSLVILDLMMPEVDGFAVLEQMRANRQTRNVPVVVMSGKLLTREDVQRLDYAHVVFYSKDLLATDEAMAALQRAFDRQDMLPQPTSALVKRAIAYMHQNYARPLTRQEISSAIGVSKNYLSQIFRQELGLSPWECLNRFRVQRAKELLRQTSESITTIAALTGFEDSAYFSRVFHKIVGQSPQAYRQQVTSQ
jgi:AraC-like DNA-binding protein